MRFILNFIFFGLLFYAIWYYFPDVFQTLVDGVGKFFETLRDVIVALWEKIESGLKREDSEKANAILLPLLLRINK